MAVALRIEADRVRARRPRGRSAWRTTFDIAAGGIVLSCTRCWTVKPSATTRRCTGAAIVR